MDSPLNMSPLEIRDQRKHMYDATSRFIIFYACSTRKRMGLKLVLPRYVTKMGMKPKI